MAFTLRGRRVAYDNIAAGSATGAERTIAGQDVSPVEVHGGGYRTSTSEGDVWHTNVAAGASVSDQAHSAVVGGELPEQVIQAGVTNTNENTASSNVAGAVTNA